MFFLKLPWHCFSNGRPIRPYNEWLQCSWKDLSEPNLSLCVSNNYGVTPNIKLEKLQVRPNHSHIRTIRNASSLNVRAFFIGKLN